MTSYLSLVSLNVMKLDKKIVYLYSDAFYVK
jgi:hypothetical protein